MRHGSLFSGIGGFDLAAEWMGWENVFHCECNEFGQRVLKHYWPKAESYGDITKTDFTQWRGAVDIITGGFPCQPYSSAGKRRGKEDERHLWPHMLRAIREIAPSYIVGENVLGLTNWNGGLVFDEVHSDLEAEGYEVQAVVIPAAAKNAPHGRDRVWFVANPDCWGRNEGSERKHNQTGEWSFCENEQKNGDKVWCDFGVSCCHWSSANSERNGLEHSKKPGIIGKGKRKAQRSTSGHFEATSWSKFPTQSPVCGGDDGLPSELDGITFSKWRAESVKAYGNAIVPQVAYEIFKAISRLH